MLTANQARKLTGENLHKIQKIFNLINTYIKNAAEDGHFLCTFPKDKLEETGNPSGIIYELEKLGYTVREQCAGSDYYTINWGKR